MTLVESARIARELPGSESAVGADGQKVHAYLGRVEVVEMRPDALEKLAAQAEDSRQRHRLVRFRRSLSTRSPSSPAGRLRAMCAGPMCRLCRR